MAEGAVGLAGAVLTAEGGAVSVGAYCVVMEGAVLRGTPGHPCHTGQHVLVGPHAHLTGCHVDELAFVATGVTIPTGASIGRLADIRINAVVHARTRLPPSGTVPIGWVAVGDPVEILPPLAHDAIWEVQRALGFRDAAFRMDDLPRERFMADMTRRYARSLGRHRADRPVEGREESAWSSLRDRLWGSR